MTSDGNLIVFDEPTLVFGHAQSVEDPRDGLSLFGPLDEGQPYGLRVGVVGTAFGIDLFRQWVGRIQGLLRDKGREEANPPFPGFEAAFGVPWSPTPTLHLTITQLALDATVHLDDRHQRVYETVSAFVNPLVEAVSREEVSPDLWFIVIPDVVYDHCRPKSFVPAATRVTVKTPLNPRRARTLHGWPSMFQEENKAALAYDFDVDFHNQLKARLLPYLQPTQIVRESTLALPPLSGSKRDKTNLQAAVAWSLSAVSFYKAGFRPWKTSGVRERVCYIGLTFKRVTQGDAKTACCAAQMFLDSGDGVVFKGAVGPWYSEDADEYHLSRDAARELVATAVAEYRRRNEGAAPRELFLHGRVWFSNDEWDGFRSAVTPAETNLVGIRIRDDSELRLFRLGTRPVLRGTAYIRNQRSAYLWTRGFTPRLGTYVGREVPRPLRIDVMRGDIDIQTVLSDVLALTKLNYNACLLADGLPVTLRFADAVGEILTAGPTTANNPLPFKFYI